MPRFPSVGSEHCPYDTHSVDLRLASEISVPVPNENFAYNLGEQGLAKFIASQSRTVQLTDDQPYLLKPNRFVLAKTLERIELPIIQGKDTCLSARIEGKSSRARCGLLVHFTAPAVHPGFERTLTLEMINLGASPIILRLGMPIA